MNEGGGWARKTLGTLLVLGAFSAGAEELLPLPDPDLSRLEPGVREKLHNAREALLVTIGDADQDSQKQGRLYGHTGKVFHAHNAYAVAEVCYRNAAVLEPDEIRWPYTLGFLYQDTGRFEEAKSRYREVLQIDPGHLFAMLRLAQTHLELGELGEASELYEQVVEQPDLAAVAHAGLARISVAQGDYEKAVVHYEKALELRPDASRLYVPLGQVYRRLGKMEQARENLERAGDAKLRVFDPILDDVGSLAVSSAMFLTAGAQALKAERFDKAVQAFRGAIAVNPENRRAHLNLGVVLAELGELDEAEASVREALRLSPDYYFAYFNLGTIYEKRGLLAEAVGFYEKALEGNPDEIKINYRLAGLLMRTNEYAAAAERYRAVVEQAPALVQARHLEALAYIALGDTATARRLLEESLEIVPQEAKLMSPLARILATTASEPEDTERALVLAKQLIETRNSLNDGETLAMALAANNRFEEAVLLQEKVIEVAREQGAEQILAHLEHNLQRYRAGHRSDRPWPVADPVLESEP
ncbi:MAG: tetratricopeptide repeat protein [Acidobacteriota bacterium]|nr:tetratricopeptide repeat protein [Acidobacteriota bacterium]